MSPGLSPEWREKNSLINTPPGSREVTVRILANALGRVNFGHKRMNQTGNVLINALIGN